MHQTTDLDGSLKHLGSGIFNGELCLLMCPYNLNNSLAFLKKHKNNKEVLVPIQIVLKQIFSMFLGVGSAVLVRPQG